jgi:hypothetical protein
MLRAVPPAISCPVAISRSRFSFVENKKHWCCVLIVYVVSSSECVYLRERLSFRSGWGCDLNLGVCVCVCVHSNLFLQVTDWLGTNFIYSS